MLTDEQIMNVARQWAALTFPTGVTATLALDEIGAAVSAWSSAVIAAQPGFRNALPEGFLALTTASSRMRLLALLLTATADALEA